MTLSLSMSVSKSFHVSLATKRFLSWLLQQCWPRFNSSPISQPVWRRAESFWGALYIRVQWQSENKTCWMEMGLVFRMSVSLFYCNGESKWIWTMTSHHRQGLLYKVWYRTLTVSESFAFFYLRHILLSVCWVPHRKCALYSVLLIWQWVFSMSYWMM